jgi:GTP-binding protein EngB required for normal cell division
MQNPNEYNNESVGQEEAPSANTDLLRKYEHFKFDLANLIHSASACATDEGNEELRREYQNLLTCLAEDRFHLAVVGQSSRGKSTLMNAILGVDRLPTGIVPITSVITSVSYGSRERVHLFFQGSNLYHEVPLVELPNYITEQGNPGNRRRIDIADVQLPAEVLQRGFYFVDTPGFGSAILENTETTRRFFPRADAFIFVTSFESPFTSEELGFLREARSRQRRVFLVVNKADLVSHGQREQVLEFLHHLLTNETDLTQFEIFPLSALEGLQAKLEGNPERLSRSGFPGFEATLVEFLTTERTRVLLRQTSERFKALLARQSHPRLASVGDRLSELHLQMFGHWQPSAATHVARALSTRALSPIGTCFVCARISGAVFDFLSRYQYELSRNMEEQEAHAERNGFCALHTWQYAKLASPQGICCAYPKLLFSLANRLRVAPQQSGRTIDLRKSIRELLADSSRCRLCQVAADAERRASVEIIRTLDGDSGGQDRAGLSLCLPHLVLILDALPEIQAGLTLVERMATALERVAENMQRYALRHEGLRGELTSDEEWLAPGLGLALVVGHCSVQPESMG